MTKKYFKKANFWAREFRQPLFCISDKKTKISEDTLALYKNSVLHYYNLDGKEVRMKSSGYRFFKNEEKVKNYEKEVKGIHKTLKEIDDEYKKTEIKKLSEKELKEKFFYILKFLNILLDAYTKTEPMFLSKIEADEKRFKKTIKKMGELRFRLRKEAETVFFILLGKLTKEIANRFNLKVKDLFFYTYDEIVKLFKSQKVRNDTIKERQKGYALISLRDKNILLTGNKFKKIFKEITKQSKKIEELTGQVVMKGMAKGKVKLILHNKKNIAKKVARFKKGEILVTEMTRPDTVFACKKAAAIITDEGGITSHAAIISRELKIPCIVGTKIATQILKDGDMMEVNANKGIIKIIKKKS